MCKPAPHADVAVKHAFIKSKYQVTANPRPIPTLHPNPNPNPNPSPSPSPSPNSSPSPNPSPNPNPNPNPEQEGAFKAGGSGVVCAVEKPHAHRAKSKGFDKGQMHAGIVVLKGRARTQRGAAAALHVHMYVHEHGHGHGDGHGHGHRGRGWALQVRHGEDLVAKDLITGT